MKTLLIAALITLFAAWAEGQEIRKVSYPLGPDMTRADLWITGSLPVPKAVLVLCPGSNGNGESYVRSEAWQRFARENHLGLVGLSFASKASDLARDQGYMKVDQGSGEILLKAIHREFGSDLPVLLYGFSSGAYLTELFVAWKPERVMAWCAHATGRYEEKPGAWPPGIVSCGEKDGSRYGAALTHFKKARAAGDPLLWISLVNREHSCPPELDDFVRAYFQAILAQSHGVWVDIDTHKVLTETQAKAQPSLSAWLPSASLLQSWIRLNSE